MKNILHKSFEFAGVKIALLYQDKVLSLLRDDKPDILFPSQWDLAGGGRELFETPFECACREIFEEFGIHLSEPMIVYCKVYEGIINPCVPSVFMVANIDQSQIDKMVFGNEGQGFKLMPIQTFLTNDNVIGFLQDRLNTYLDEQDVNLDLS